MPQDTAVTPVITASGTTWAQFKTGGLFALLANLASTNAAKADPSVAATVNVTGGGASGGNLPAGDYFVSYSWVDAAGETLAGGRSTSFTVASGNIPRVTIPSLPTGCSFACIYLTPTGGAAGTEYLYGTGITGTTFDLSYALPTDVPGATVPRANTTGLGTDQAGAFLRGLSDWPNAEKVNRATALFFDPHLSGAPVSRHRWILGAFWRGAYLRAWGVAFQEAVVLLVANQGTLGWTTGPGVGNPIYKRTLA